MLHGKKEEPHLDELVTAWEIQKVNI
jgi:hypothetical protein